MEPAGTSYQTILRDAGSADQQQEGEGANKTRQPEFMSMESAVNCVSGAEIKQAGADVR